MTDFPVPDGYGPATCGASVRDCGKASLGSSTLETEEPGKKLRQAG